MHARQEAVPLPRRENALRFLMRKHVMIAKDAAELRQFFFGDARNHLIGDHADVIPLVVVKFGRNVQRHEGRHDVNRMMFVQVAHRLQQLDFVVNGQAVAGFRFNRRGAAPQHSV